MTAREIQYVEVAGREIAAVHCICPICKTLNLNMEFEPNDSLDGLIAVCPLGHRWEIPKEKCN